MENVLQEEAKHDRHGAEAQSHGRDGANSKAYALYQPQSKTFLG
jgi:hypothetical protein